MMASRKRRASLASGLGAVVLLACTLAGCYQTVHVTEEMLWDCGPSLPMEPPHDLRLRYVESPSYVEYVADSSVCSTLAKSNQKTVRVQFEVRGNRWTGLKGYRIVAVDRVIPLSPGQVGSGREGPSAGPLPLSKHFQR